MLMSCDASSMSVDSVITGGFTGDIKYTTVQDEECDENHDTTTGKHANWRLSKLITFA